MRRSKFPYVVEIAGAVRRMRKVAMHNFHVRPGHRGASDKHSKKHGRSNRWRFASLTDAEKFARQFGGSLMAGH
jgi:hypothetical protein